MGLLSGIRAYLGRGRVERVYLGDGARAVAGLDVGQLYAEQPHLRTVVDFLARNVAQLPLKCYVRESDTDRRRDTDSPLALLLADPNPDTTGYELIFSTVAEMKLYDRAIWLVGLDSKSRSGYQIRLIPHDWVSGWGGASGWGFEWLEFANPGVAMPPVHVDASHCVIFHGYAPGDPAQGSSPVQSLRGTLTEQIEAQRFRTQAWRRSARITSYITRPKDAPGWTEVGQRRFVEQVRANWSGDGEGAGGTPVLEDGMELKAVEFSAREKDWASGVRLSREDVAAAYHVNPAVIWPGDGQTYASAKDNARSLYADTLAPDLRMLADRINKDLLPMLGCDPSEYVEFDISAKMQGSFEEQAAAMQTSVGGPWLTRNEARARMNLPAIDGGDELIVPLNVIEGGLASPTDTAPKSRGCGCPACKSVETWDAPPKGRKAHGDPTDEEGEAYAAALARFFSRQRRAVLAGMDARGRKAVKADGETPAWWDADRWDRELTDDLLAAALSGSVAAAKRALESLGIDPAGYDEERTRAYLRAMVAARATGINAVTLAQLRAAVDGDLSDDAEGSTPEGVFDKAEGPRGATAAASLATAVAGWSVMEAARQRAPSTTVKTWRTHSGGKTRPSHARMNGQTVPVSKRFSNGADWPGDTGALRVEEVANCRCTVDITVPD